MVYRSHGQAPKKKPRSGLVEEVVGQFADKFAYARELVQNSIDAGAQNIGIRIAEDHDRLVVIFEDDGLGMPLDVIQGPLLTVFLSSKEGEKGKIGKYGIGFKSVLAVDPERVVIDTRTASTRHVVHLYRDHNFEIEELPGSPQRGTSVTLYIPGDGQVRREHTTSLQAAIVRWCRHVRCPVSLSVHGERERSINAPLDMDAWVQAELERDEIRAVVAPTVASRDQGGGHERPGDFAGFYSHGLTIFEVAARDPAIGSHRFKVDSPRLSATVSRDDVRRDKAFQEAMSAVRACAALLPDRIKHELAAEARRFAEQSASHHRYLSLLRAAVEMGTPKTTMVALLEPFGLPGGKTPPGHPPVGQSQWSISRDQMDALRKQGRLFGAERSNDFTKLVAARGNCIVHLVDGDAVRNLLGPFSDPRERFVRLIAQDPPLGPGRAAIDGLGRVLSRAGRPVTGIIVVAADEGDFQGAGVFVDGSSEGQGQWLIPTDMNRQGDLLLLKSTVFATLLSAQNLLRATVMLARIVLVASGGTLSEKQNDELLAVTIEDGL